jgi:hypothetical protein
MKPKTEINTTSLAVIGVDIGKEAFHPIEFGPTGRSPFAGRSGGSASKMRLSGNRPASLGWRPV